jgi:hypothetical protein
MMKKDKYHLEPNRVKYDIIDLLIKTADPVIEPKILEELKNKYGGISQSNVNRPLHWLHKKGCVELEKSRSNIWSVKTLKNLENILVQYPDFVGFLQNSELALKIVLDGLEDALISSINLKRTKEYKEKYEEIKERLLNIRKDLTEKLKISTSFFELCIRDDYSLYRNLSDLLEISENPTAEAYIGDNFKLFIKSPSCIDLAFKSCVAIEIMSRPVNSIKDMKKEIEYVKEMNNVLPNNQLDELKKYYEKLKNEADILKQIENTDPEKQLECLKQHYKKRLKAPCFLQANKFVPVTNSELSELETAFVKNDGEWEYFKDEEPEGPA